MLGLIPNVESSTPLEVAVLSPDSSTPNSPVETSCLTQWGHTALCSKNQATQQWWVASWRSGFS